MGVPARNTAVRSASPRPVFVLITTKTGTTARRTEAARNTRPFQTIIDFPLTAAVSVLNGLTPCGRNVSVIIPALRHQYILSSLVSRDLISKYRKSKLGVLWSILTPLGLVLIVGAVYSIIFGADPKEFIPSLFAGLNPWLFMSGTADAATLH